MEINEAFRRIFLVRWKALLLCVLLAVGGGLLLHAGEPVLYAASVRLTLDAPDPTSETEAGVIADTAQAIVTSPSRVRDALGEAGVTGNPLEVIEKHISVEPLGSSGVLRLEVTDNDPAAAAGVANALARDLIETRLESRDAPLADALGELDQRIEELRQEIDGLSEHIFSATPDASLRLNRERELLVQRQLILEQQRGALIGAEIERPKPSIIDAASPVSAPEPSGRLPDAALALVLGVILGIGAAAALESLHPTLVGRGPLSRELDAPVLGELRRGPRPAPPTGGASLQTLLRLAAKSARVQTVELIVVDGVADARAIADLLRADDLPDLRPVDDSTDPSSGTSSRGAILLVPRQVRKSALEPAEDLLAISGWPLLGIVICRLRSGTLVSRFRRTEQPRLHVESAA
jgi:capsular polysaccharide biosynthesis protein